MEKAHAPIHAVVAAGVSWSQVLQWISEYGLPMLLKVLSIVGPLLMSGAKLPTEQLVRWISDALEALFKGDPVPPVPEPASGS